MLTLSYHQCLGLPSNSSLTGFHTKVLICFSALSHSCYMPAHLTFIDLIIVLRCYLVQNTFHGTLLFAYVVNFGLCGVLIPKTCDYFINNNKQTFWVNYTVFCEVRILFRWPQFFRGTKGI